ncbi:junction-mediating and -regulatory protein [Puma concolor]|uniref:Junction-mediating and -regulatory protein n=1 Tax=Puma concolor TaxID=9696 RepID=A0A6P6HVY0_PUMCO|nr:junction-mediating and -regulatory protein [Puma concolor]
MPGQRVQWQKHPVGQQEETNCLLRQSALSMVLKSEMEGSQRKLQWPSPGRRELAKDHTAGKLRRQDSSHVGMAPGPVVFATILHELLVLLVSLVLPFQNPLQCKNNNYFGGGVLCSGDGQCGWEMENSSVQAGGSDPAGRDVAGAASSAPPEAPVSSVRVVSACGAVSEEIEVLEMVREDEVAPGALALSDAEQPPPTAELESPAEECSWAGLFSFQDLRAVHQQLCSVNSQLEQCLPVFPEEPSGMWTVLFGGAPEMTEQEIDTLCYQLQVYLGHGLDTCGWKILSQVLFTETDDPEEYYESLSELRQKGYEEVLQRARKRIQEISMENDYLGPRRIESLQKEDADWQRKAHMAVLSIQDLTVKYFEITAKAQKAVYDRMRADQKKFGKASWAAAAERMEKLQYAVSKETLQMMRAKEICLEQRKHALKEEMQSLQGGTEAIARLDQLEADYYDLQLQLYEVQFEILKCEELLLTAQLESIKRLISEKRDEVVYYDTYESMEAMLEKEEMAVSVHLQREELQKLQQKARQLEARRGRVSAKKAYLRNKKEICIAKHNEKFQQRLRSEDEYRAHHTVQLKREKLHDEEERKSAWVSQERQRTLDRLRTFKQRYPGQVILKSTRLRLAHARRRSTASPVPCEDQCDSLPGALQVEEKSAKAEEGIGELGSSHKTEAQSLAHLEDTSLAQLEAASLPLSGVTSELPPTVSLPLLNNTDLEPGSVTIDPLPPPLPPTPPPLSLAITVLKSRGYQFDSNWDPNCNSSLSFYKVSSPMDEVLASLKRGSFHLKKVEQRTLPPFPDEDDSNNILAQIRKGVKLKKVQKEVLRESFTLLPDTDPLTRSIHEALRRIKEASPESEDEEEALPCTDWEN